MDTKEMVRIYEEASDEGREFINLILKSVTHKTPFLYIFSKGRKIRTFEDSEYIEEAHRLLYRLSMKYTYNKKKKV